MGASTSLLLQSNYFLPSFNMAIFDGPFRLYFAQNQESEALRLYFELHEIIGSKMRPANMGTNIENALFVLLYPDETTFDSLFKTEKDHSTHWVGDSEIVALRGPVWKDSVLSLLTDRIEEFFGKKKERNLATAEA